MSVKMKNIILIGFMGVGKGSVARELVKETGMIALDTDDIIESMENRRIKKIFATDGEKYFRDIEQQVSKWLEKSVKNSIISTGGGFYKVKNLRKIGTVVLLDSPFEKIYERIVSHPNSQSKLKKRPLLQDLEKAKTLYDEREPQYKKVADVVIDVTDKSLKDIVSEIQKRVKA
jgi:shikimate kinase